MAFSLRCLLIGHDDRIARLPPRIWLHCDHCGRETKGWEVGPKAPICDERAHLPSLRSLWEAYAIRQS